MAVGVLRGSGRRVATVVVGAAVLTGCSVGDAGETVAVEGGSFERVEAAAFDDLVDDPAVVTINVHVPYEGEILGTELFVPFDEVLTAAAFPTDVDAPIAIYCRSGAMSTAAAEALVRAGYTEVVELDGGMNAWRADDRPIVDVG